MVGVAVGRGVLVGRGVNVGRGVTVVAATTTGARSPMGINSMSRQRKSWKCLNERSTPFSRFIRRSWFGQTTPIRFHCSTKVQNVYVLAGLSRDWLGLGEIPVGIL